jgi:hypothetical protein
MGTPRPLKAVDQIRNEQRTASVGGECATTGALESRNFWLPTSELGETVTADATNAALTS